MFLVCCLSSLEGRLRMSFCHGVPLVYDRTKSLLERPSRFSHSAPLPLRASGAVQRTRLVTTPCAFPESHLRGDTFLRLPLLLQTYLQQLWGFWISLGWSNQHVPVFEARLDKVLTNLIQWEVSLPMAGVVVTRWSSRSTPILNVLWFCLLNVFQVLFRVKQLLKKITQRSALRLKSLVAQDILNNILNN